jgi:putative DNA methylase
MALEPFAWKDRPALIESLFPVQKISIESFKEQMAGTGKTLTPLGSYWKGRKPLILNKACVLGCLLPASSDAENDLEVFELLMGMDHRSVAKRLQEKNDKNSRFFLTDTGSVSLEKNASYQDWISTACRPEECDPDELFSHIWERVNNYLGTSANCFPELVEQMGIARFGHRPRVADVFSGSGQIPFEAARLGCDVYASDVNPVACLLTWGAFNIVGALPEKRSELEEQQQKLVGQVQSVIDSLGVEKDGRGWRAKVFLYCVEARCPESGWMVPLLPSLIVSQPRTGKKNNVVAKLIPIPSEKRYKIEIIEWISDTDLAAYSVGSIQNGEMVHSPDGCNIYRTKISTLQGDYKEGNLPKSRVRPWRKTDFTPDSNDIFIERLYCIQWTREATSGSGDEYQFRSVTNDDLDRENIVIDYVKKHLPEWQIAGFSPDSRIEPGGPPRYQARSLATNRGWNYWSHLFNPRQLLLAALVKKHVNANTSFGLLQILNWNSRLCIWNNQSGGGGSIQNTFYNQALSTLFSYGCRSSRLGLKLIETSYRFHAFRKDIGLTVQNHSAEDIPSQNDIYITDPPYGDAVKYEEITEFFIAWLRKNPPEEFASWTWDSRRSIAIKGEDEAFRQGMISAYRRTREMMPDNGIQVLMFTHQSGSIWADMANIIWASGLQVTAAWYVVTESDSALRQGANVTGTIMLVLRKRLGSASSFRDDLGWEIEEAVKQQIESLTGLDQKVRDKGSEGLYTDADLQMAGYAAALKVLTAYSHIDGKDMVVESEAPKQKGKKSFVEDLIDFAVQTAVQFLVPMGFEKGEWQKLTAIERFYLKMAEMEHMGEKSLDNYQNFAKAFKVKNFDVVMSDRSKANSARLKLSSELKGSQVTGDGELPGTPLRALLYAFFELSKGVEAEDVLNHLGQTYSNYLRDKKLLAKMADYLADKRGTLKPGKNFAPEEEASHARILAEALRNQKL